MKIIWSKAIEEENKAEIAKYLDQFSYLIPKWCQHLYINLYSAEDNGAISTLVDYEYRRVTFDFYSCWLIQDKEKKRNDVLHECVHASVNELYHQARRVVIATCENNEDLKSYAFGQLELAVESVTQDLTFAILNK